MPKIVHFTVSQVRVAATCPRILYFDLDETRRKQLKYPRVTRIWKDGDTDVTACGTLFHNAIEKFNSEAARSKPLAEALLTADGAADFEQRLRRIIFDGYVDRKQLDCATGDQQEAFVTSLCRYVKELAEILAYAVSQKISMPQILDQMFGDNRRRVDVTFHVGEHGEAVHVTGILDYVFFDWRIERRRIIDYKLTPGLQSRNDLFQVGLYALMHNKQHGTEPDVAVLYLHPDRHIEGDKWENVYRQRYKIYDLLASMAAWARYDEKTQTGLKPPGDPSYCGHCPWSEVCVARLGSKNEGARCSTWGDAEGGRAEPKIEHVEPPVVPPEEGDGEAVPIIETRHDDELPADSLWLGYAEHDDRIRAGLSSAVLATHTAVVGSAGSGKTWLAKGIVEEAILQGIPVLAIDPQGDLVQFLRRSDSKSLPAWERRRFDRFNSRVETRVFTPGSSQAVRLALDPLPIPRADQLTEIKDPVRRKEEYDGMLASSAANLTGLVQMGTETDSICAFLLQLLRGLNARGSNKRVTLERIVAAVRDPDELGVGDPDAFVRKADRERLGRKLNALLHGPSGQLFRDGLKFDMDWMRRPLTEGRTPLNVIYLNALTDDHQKQFFVASVAAEIYRWMIGRAETGRMNLLVYLDEARDYIPSGMRMPPAKEPLVRLFKQGRKYGVGCLLCTQSPRSVDYNVFGNCSTKIIGRLESAQDVARVGEWFSTGGAPPWLADRKGAVRGSFIGRWPEMPLEFEGRAFRSRPLFSLHEGAWSPDRLEREMAEDPVRRELRKPSPA